MRVHGDPLLVKHYIEYGLVKASMPPRRTADKYASTPWQYTTNSIPPEDPCTAARVPLKASSI